MAFRTGGEISRLYCHGGKRILFDDREQNLALGRLSRLFYKYPRPRNGIQWPFHTGSFGVTRRHEGSMEVGWSMKRTTQ